MILKKRIFPNFNFKALKMLSELNLNFIVFFFNPFSFPNSINSRINFLQAGYPFESLLAFFLGKIIGSFKIIEAKYKIVVSRISFLLANSL